MAAAPSASPTCGLRRRRECTFAVAQGCLFAFAGFAEDDRYLADLDAPLADTRAVDQHAVRLQEHPVVEAYPPGPVADLEIKIVAPVQCVAVSDAAGGADDVVGGAFVAMLV